MTSSASFDTLESLQADIAELITRLPTLKNRQFIQQALATIVRLGDTEIERLDWKILSGALADMERGFQLFLCLPTRSQSHHLRFCSSSARYTRIPNGP